MVTDPPVNSGRAKDLPPGSATGHTLTLHEGIGWTLVELQELQAGDRDIGPAVVWMKQNQHPPRENIESESFELKTYWTQWESLVMVDGLVYRSFQRPDSTCKHLQLLVPRSIRTAFLESVHARTSGHFAWRKTQDQVQRRAYWASWKTDTKLFCACCKGYRYIMTACDAFTRFVIAVPLRNKTAISAARALVHEVVLKYGMPHCILTDLGGEFQNELWHELCRLLGITRLRTTAYCPSTNGKIER